MTTREPSAAQRAHREIRAAIASGDLAGGTMVSENELAARIGVSRTPVRAALLRLQDEGWITVYPQRGALVREIGPDEAHHIADGRHALELASARRLTAAGRTRLADTLTVVVDAQERDVDDGDLDRFVERDIEFHRDIVQAGGNPLLLDFYDRLRDRQALVIARRVSATADRAARIVTEHRALVTVIREGRWDELDVTLRAHLLGTHAPGTVD